ncbi:MAG TPA: PhzF family phenazine biosynthesis protein [Bacteroidota bacterium]|nr:PhzF family phenazine biosynthesis protein [Bacteroidota bacterium]
MGKIKIKEVDAFTTIPQTGNPAGVVLEGKNLTEKQMQAIAREINLSETAFILPPTKQQADMRIRWFTPTMEVPLCGHATIASFHCMAEEGAYGMTKKGEYHFELETASGVLPVDVIKNDVITVMFGLKIPIFEKGQHFKIDLVRILNTPISDFDNRINIVRTDYLYVPIRRLHNLFTMKPNFLTMTNFLNTRKLRGVCIYTTETVDRESVVHSRFFAPNCGINEDPVTGSSHGPLAILLFEQGNLDVQDGRCIFQGEQGDPIGRRGRVKVELLVDNSKPVSVKIGGNAVTVLEGEMLLQD